MTSIYSWNVNGIRAWVQKDALKWLRRESPDILALQETKAAPEQLDEVLLQVPGYVSFWRSAKRKGYSGVCLYSREEPISTESLGDDLFDDEGRVLIAHYPSFTLLNCYFPNSQPEGARLDYKLAFCEAVLKKSNALIRAGKNIIICGDFNIAHTEIDLKNPGTNRNNPGFLPEERNWMTMFLENGYVDSFRAFHPGEKGYYTWWSYRFQARKRNIGWRIDYHCLNREFFPAVKEARIHSDVFGSDHCPVSITLNL